MSCLVYQAQQTTYIRNVLSWVQYVGCRLATTTVWLQNELGCQLRTVAAGNQLSAFANVLVCHTFGFVEEMHLYNRLVFAQISCLSYGSIYGIFYVDKV